jgi:hypothetical protein
MKPIQAIRPVRNTSMAIWENTASFIATPISTDV